MSYDLSDAGFLLTTTENYQQECGFKPNLSNPNLKWVMFNPATGKKVAYRHRDVRHEQLLTALSRGWQVYLIEFEDVKEWKNDLALGDVRLLSVEYIYHIVTPEQEASANADPSEEELLELRCNLGL